MTQKDYEKIAHILRAPLTAEVVERSVRNKIAREFAIVLQNDNERFDATKFFQACGYDAD
jgi:hypothetical protein